MIHFIMRVWLDQSKLDNQKNYYLTFVDQLSVDAQDDSKTNIGSYVKGTDNNNLYSVTF